MPAWRIRIAQRAERDINDTLAWTLQEFGPNQMDAYRGLIDAAILRLGDGPNLPGSRPADPGRPALRLLHLGRRGRHVLVFREGPPGVVLVLRLLHDTMDLTRHLP